MAFPLDPSLVLGLVIAAVCLFGVLVLVLIALALGKWQQALSVAHRTPPTKPSRRAGIWVLVISTIFWSTMTLLADGIIGHFTVRQLQSPNFAMVEGVVLKCAVKDPSDSDGTFSSVDIVYSYEVRGRRYTGDRIRYGTSWSDRQEGTRFVDEHPPGSTIAVFYDPDDPATAMLRPGVVGEDLFLPLFMIPFNMVMIALVCTCVGYGVLRPKAGLRLMYGVRIIEKDDVIRIRLPPVSPACGALATLGGGAFALTFFVACCLCFPSSVIVMAVVWGVLLASTVVVYLYLTLRVASGKTDLVIDPLRKTLTLPQTFGRKEAVVMSLTDVLAVDVVHVATRTSEGTDHTYAPTVRWRDAAGAPQEAKLAEWNDEELAQLLAAWIGARVFSPDGVRP